MGIYINQMPDGSDLPKKDMTDTLLRIPGAYQIYPPPTAWEPDLVCVIENENWDAAAYIFDLKELFRCSRPGERRRRSWLHVPDAKDLTLLGSNK